MSYRAWCAACGLETTLETLDEVLDLTEEHKTEHGNDHVVEFRRLD